MKKVNLVLILLLSSLNSVFAHNLVFAINTEEFTLNKKYVQDVALRIGKNKEYLLGITLNKKGQKRFEEFLKRNINKDENHLNILFNNKIVLTLIVHETSFSNFTMIISNKLQALLTATDKDPEISLQSLSSLIKENK